MTVRREAARVLLLDARDRVLLIEGGDPARPELGTWWITPGGGLEGDETAEEGALRELAEETGLRLDALGEPILDRVARFSFDGVDTEQHETWFAARAPEFELSQAGWTDLEQRAMVRLRWWTIPEIEATTERVFPEHLAAVARAALEQAPQRSPRSWGPA